MSTVERPTTQPTQAVDTITKPPVSAPPAISASDIRSLVYFWEEKEDLERCVSWDRMQAELQAKYPEILKAWTDYKTSRVILAAVLRHANDRAEREEYEREHKS